MLPRQNAGFQILNGEMSSFVKEFDDEMNSDFIFKFEEIIDFNVMFMDMVLKSEE